MKTTWPLSTIRKEPPLFLHEEMRSDSSKTGC